MDFACLQRRRDLSPPAMKPEIKPECDSVSESTSRVSVGNDRCDAPRCAYSYADVSSDMIPEFSTDTVLESEPVESYGECKNNSRSMPFQPY